jgi:hypothetical protein
MSLQKKENRNPSTYFPLRLSALLLLASLLLAATACSVTKPVSLDVQFPVAKYSLMMSSVPGLPLEIRAEKGAQVQAIVSEGDFLRWGPETDSKVLSKGRNYTFEATSDATTLYWSPLLDGSGGRVEIASGKSLRVTVTATMPDRPTHTVIVLISMDDNTYSAKVE